MGEPKPGTYPGGTGLGVGPGRGPSRGRTAGECGGWGGRKPYNRISVIHGADSRLCGPEGGAASCSLHPLGRPGPSQVL